MLIEMKCSNCGAPMQFDDAREFMFCEYCGNKMVNLHEQVNINHTGTVYHVQDRSNEPNLYISYNTSNPSVGLVSRIVSTGQKSTYVNGQTLSFHVNQGRQTVVLKIGRRNYNRDIIIPPDNSPVRIYASFNGRSQITIDQPNVPVAPVQTQNAPANAQYAQTFSNSNPQGTITNIQSPQGQTYQPINNGGGKRKSGLSILAFVLSLTIYLSWIGAGLGALNMFVFDKEKKNNHIFDLLALIIGGLFTLFLMFILFGSSGASSTATTSAIK